MGKRGPKPRDVIDLTWRPDLAYAVGLLASDGCLLNDRRHVDFTSADLDLVQTYREVLGLRHVVIGKKLTGHGTSAYRLQLGNVVFCQWLESIGFTPHKSKTLGVIAIPDKFFFDFLRGVWDGDGTIYAYWDSRWASSYMFYIAFASGSRPFLKWLNTQIQALAGIDGRFSEGSRAFQLRYAKSGSRILFKRMFYESDLPHLRRKFAKAQKIFRIDEREHARVL